MSQAANANLVARLFERAALHPERTAIVECRGAQSRRMTYAGLGADVAARAAALRSRGCGPGDRVLVFVPMSIALYGVLLAVLHVGAVAVFVDAWADRRRFEMAVRRTRPRVFAGVARAHLLRLLSPAVRAIPAAMWVRRASARQPGSEHARPPELLTESAPALVTFTTGSTGTPKAAMRSHGFLWSQHVALAQHLRHLETDVDMPTLPVFVLDNLASGITSVLPDFDPKRPGDIDPARIHAQMTRERVTTSSGSPAFYERLADWCRERGERLPLRTLATGGAPVLPPLVRSLRAVANEVQVVYGSTEAEPIAGIEAAEMLAAMDDERGPTPEGLCAGREVSAIQLKLVRPHDGPLQLDERGWSAWEVGEGEVGEVVVTGEHVLPGYLDDPEAERAHKVRDGARVWHRTGDAARRDALGRLWLMGRLQQRVRRSGSTWWPAPAELRALTVPGVRHAAYFGERDDTLGERAVLCVEHLEGRLTADAEARLRAVVAPAPVDELRVLRRIPRDPRHASKTDLGALRQMLERG